MKPSRLLALLLIVAARPLPAAEPLQPDEGASISPWAIRGFHEVASPDNKIFASVVFEQVGHTYNDYRPWVTFEDLGGDSGSDLHSTTYSLPPINGGKPAPEFRLTKIGEGHYRFAYDASYSVVDSPAAMLNFSYDITLDDGGMVSRVVPHRVYSSYWNYDGSLMGLVASGNHRSVYYVKPRQGSGVLPGTLLFTGTSDGKKYSGTIRDWSPTGHDGYFNDDQLDYGVSGPILDAGSKIVLKGKPLDIRDGQPVARDMETTHVLTLDSKPAPDRE